MGMNRSMAKSEGNPKAIGQARAKAVAAFARVLVLIMPMAMGMASIYLFYRDQYVSA